MVASPHGLLYGHRASPSAQPTCPAEPATSEMTTAEMLRFYPHLRDRKRPILITRGPLIVHASSYLWERETEIRISGDRFVVYQCKYTQVGPRRLGTEEILGRAETFDAAVAIADAAAAELLAQRPWALKCSSTAQIDIGRVGRALRYCEDQRSGGAA